MKWVVFFCAHIPKGTKNVQNFQLWQRVCKKCMFLLLLLLVVLQQANQPTTTTTTTFNQICLNFWIVQQED
jgi:hypothetical protein